MAHHHDISVPKPLLLGAAAMMAMTIVLATLGANGVLGSKSLAPPSTAEVWADLRFEDRADSGIDVLAAEDNSTLVVLPPGEGGFVRGMLRGLAHDRRKHGYGAGPAFRLTRWSDGRLSIHDMATGRTHTLNGFGETNRVAFERLLRAGMTAPGAPPTIVSRK